MYRLFLIIKRKKSTEKPSFMLTIHYMYNLPLKTLQTNDSWLKQPHLQSQQITHTASATFISHRRSAEVFSDDEKCSQMMRSVLGWWEVFSDDWEVFSDDWEVFSDDKKCSRMMRSIFRWWEVFSDDKKCSRMMRSVLGWWEVFSDEKCSRMMRSVLGWWEVFSDDEKCSRMMRSVLGWWEVFSDDVCLCVYACVYVCLWKEASKYFI